MHGEALRFHGLCGFKNPWHTSEWPKLISDCDVPFEWRRLDFVKTLRVWNVCRTWLSGDDHTLQVLKVLRWCSASVQEGDLLSCSAAAICKSKCHCSCCYGGGCGWKPANIDVFHVCVVALPISTRSKNVITCRAMRTLPKVAGVLLAKDTRDWKETCLDANPNPQNYRLRAADLAQSSSFVDSTCSRVGAEQSQRESAAKISPYPIVHLHFWLRRGTLLRLMTTQGAPVSNPHPMRAVQKKDGSARAWPFCDWALCPVAMANGDDKLQQLLSFTVPVGVGLHVRRAYSLAAKARWRWRPSSAKYPRLMQARVLS